MVFIVTNSSEMIGLLIEEMKLPNPHLLHQIRALLRDRIQMYAKRLPTGNFG